MVRSRSISHWASVVKPLDMFIFVTCQVGAEPTVKKDLAPIAKFAFSRPGFVTFKSEVDLKGDFAVSSIFARSYGISVGKFGIDTAKILVEIRRIQAKEDHFGKMRLHVLERDQFAPSEEPKDYKNGEWVKSVKKGILAQKGFGSLFHDGFTAEVGDLVIDLIAVEEKEWWLGYHVHTLDHSPYPGGVTPVKMHPKAPSRAYLKLEESLIWSGAPIQKGDIAVEIGSAPGGASFALLERGLKVVGIDPAQMDPMILQNPNYMHIENVVAQVPREQLPETVEWLLLDMNVAPRISLFQVDRLATRLKDSLLGVILTIKLNEWKMADEIPSMLEHLRAMGMVRLRAAQLSHFRQEILIYGLTRKGLTRKPPAKS